MKKMRNRIGLPRPPAVEIFDNGDKAENILRDTFKII